MILDTPFLIDLMRNDPQAIAKSQELDSPTTLLSIALANYSLLMNNSVH